MVGSWRMKAHKWQPSGETEHAFELRYLQVSLRRLVMWRINSLLGAAFNGWVALGGFTKLSLCIVAVGAGAAINSDVVSKSLRLDLFWPDKDKTAPVDYGYGPGAGKGPARPNLVLGQTPAIPRSMHAAPNALPGTVPMGGGAGGFLAPRFLGRSYRFTWSCCPTGAS